tara:strand:+ start:387 stop:815 length:429 start_codon:yes stop_codon:yes gene_type:complete
MKNIKKVLFVCTGNSCRSQIAEGILKQKSNQIFDVFSAGSHPSRVHPSAIKIMEEVGIDISHHTSNHIDEYLKDEIDIVITVCDNAYKTCPVFPGNVQRIHWSIKDPFRDWDQDPSHLKNFRKTRIELEDRINKFLKEAGSI